MEIKDKVYYTKFLLAVRTVLVCHILTILDALYGLPNAQLWGVGFGWLMVVVDWAIMVYIFKLDEKLGSKGKVFMEGLGTYVLGWVSLWTITYTLLHWLLWPEIWIEYNVNPINTLWILLLSFGIVFGTSGLARIMMDIPRLKRYQKEIDKHKKMEKEAKETKNRKLMIKVKRKQKYIEKIQRKMMWQRLKPTLITMIPFMVMFFILNWFFTGVLVGFFPFNAWEAPIVGMFIQGIPVSPRGFALYFFGFYLTSSFGFSFIVQKVLGIKFGGMGGGFGGFDSFGQK
ncbi:MAG: EMC3/TMCO1 family protein [Candidatus Helarchaeota archaeon]